MKRTRVLFTGGTGFVGKNVLPMLTEKFDVKAPKRSDLNLYEEAAIEKYLIENKIDVILHCANPNPVKNSLDKSDKMVRDSLQMFLSLYNNRNLVDKIIYLGSGAVYDKSKDIISAKETDCFGTIPKDDYGFAKYVMNFMTKENVYNLCVFGCYGPGDAESKFITHCIRCCLRKESITIRQNCMFDYLHVFDLGKIMSWAINGKPKYNRYNTCSGKKVSLLEIAQIVKQKMHSDEEILVLKNGWNNEYTGTNNRLREEYKDEFISLERGIEMQIQWELDNYSGFKEFPKPFAYM